MVRVADLQPHRKAQLWRAVQHRRPDIAEAWSTLKDDPFVTLLRDQFGGSFVLEQSLFESLMRDDHA